jgi:adenine phosphoribosyltransferase
MDFNKYIRDIPDFPKPGIMFKDITPLCKDKEAFAAVIKEFANKYKDAGITTICGIEARGFIFGAALALEMGVGFVPIRKAGKLPYKTVKKEYSLEYGTDSIEIHADAVEKGEKVLLIDDLMATGGTAKAAVDLLEDIGADLVAIAFVIELCDLKGIEKFDKEKVFCLLKY